MEKKKNIYIYVTAEMFLHFRCVWGQDASKHHVKDGLLACLCLLFSCGGTAVRRGVRTDLNIWFAFDRVSE